MFCPNCGKRVEREDATFCPACGAPLGTEHQPDAIPPAPKASNAELTSKMPRMAEVAPEAYPQSQAQPQPEGDGQQKRTVHRGRRIALEVILALVVAAGIGGGLWWKAESDRRAQEAADAAAQQAAWDADHAERAVHINIVAPNYSSQATRIPLHVTGTDLDQAGVDQTFYVNADNPDIQLKKGTYQIAVVASPILQDGSLYAMPANPVSVTVGDSADGSDGENSNSGSSDASQPVVTAEIDLAPIDDPTTVTDEQIAAAKAAAAADPDSDEAAKADPYATAATKRRDDAVAAQKQAEEEAQRKQQEAATQQQRSQAAVSFVSAYETNAYVDGSGEVQTIDTEQWRSQALRYVDPSSSLYADIASIPFLESASLTRNVRVTGVSGDTYTVTFEQTGGNNDPSEWVDDYQTQTKTVTFNDKNLVTSVS